MEESEPRLIFILENEFAIFLTLGNPLGDCIFGYGARKPDED